MALMVWDQDGRCEGGCLDSRGPTRPRIILEHERPLYILEAYTCNILIERSTSDNCETLQLCCIHAVPAFHSITLNHDHVL